MAPAIGISGLVAEDGNKLAGLGGVEVVSARGETSGSRWGEFIVELAYARKQDTEPDAGPVPTRSRPSLRVVPDPPSELLPALPRRPSRRAVVRAQVWGVPISRSGRQADQVNDEAALDSRIAEAVRLLGRL